MRVVLADDHRMMRDDVIAMLEAGAVGYLLKNSASEELLTALTAVTRGETYLSPAIAGSVVAQAIQGGSAARSSEQRELSVRERVVSARAMHRVCRADNSAESRAQRSGQRGWCASVRTKCDKRAFAGSNKPTAARSLYPPAQ